MLPALLLPVLIPGCLGRGADPAALRPEPAICVFGQLATDGSDADDLWLCFEK